jgi:alkylation response protein AidB-like acyl-CoA dehydrogenase
VDPDLSPDQRLLAETTERFIRDRLPLEGVRRLAEDGAGVDAGYRSQAGELGWFAFLGPEDLGGGGVSGAGLHDAAILAELAGAGLQPGNLVDTNVVVDTLTRENGADGGGTAKELAALAAGESAAAWALSGGPGDWSGPGGVEYRTVDGGYRLSGRKTLVVEARSAELLLVTAAGPAGPAQFLLPAGTPGLRVSRPAGLDLTRSLDRVELDDVQVDAGALVGREGAAGPAIERQLDVASVLAAAGTVGAMRYLFDLTVAYARDRIAFGRPIGSFQAVKHQLADASLALEMSQACASGAARELQSGAPGASAAASMAKAFVGEAAVEVAHVCWQLFGGISYTWEHDFHLYLRRLTADADLYGSPAWHRERVCRLAGV